MCPGSLLIFQAWRSLARPPKTSDVDSFFLPYSVHPGVIMVIIEISLARFAFQGLHTPCSDEAAAAIP